MNRPESAASAALHGCLATPGVTGKSSASRPAPGCQTPRGPAWRVATWWLVLVAGLQLAAATNQTEVLFVAGAPGEPQYASNLVRQAALWSRACEAAGARLRILGLTGPGIVDDGELLRQELAGTGKTGADPFWLVLAGHGTFDGKEARFNLRGPDLTPADLAGWLEPFRRPLIVIDATSASAPFLNALAGTNRIVITATRSGNEQNWARFGEHFAAAVVDPAGDLDQDGQTSLLEAFLTASAGVVEFYRSEGRLATEHALIEDTGDGRGTPADWFRGVRAIRRPAEGAVADGARAHQLHLLPSAEELALPPDVRARRDALELALFRLRETKAKRPEAEYYRELERLLLELARLLEGDRSAR